MQTNAVHTLKSIQELPEHTIRLADIYNQFGRRMYDAIRKVASDGQKITAYHVKPNDDAKRGLWFVVAEGCAEDFSIYGPLVKRALEALYSRQDLAEIKADIARVEREYDESRATESPVTDLSVADAISECELPATRAQADRLESLLSQVLDHLTRPAAGGLTHLANIA